MSYYIQNKNESGLVLWAMMPCGIKRPVMRWPSLEDMVVFAQWLLECRDSFAPKPESYLNKVINDAEDRESVDRLLREALGDEYPTQLDGSPD